VRIRLAIAVVILVSVALTGCGMAVGYATGSAVDSAVPGPFQQWKDGNEPLLPGTRVRVHRVNGSTLEGDFVRLGRAVTLDSGPGWVVDGDGGRVEVEAIDIHRVEVETEGSGPLIGVLVGAAADVAFIVFWSTVDRDGPSRAVGAD